MMTSPTTREYRGDCEARPTIARMRICLVTPFSWSQPHEANDHVAGAAAALRRRGHEVTVLAPSGRAAELQAGRRGLPPGEVGGGRAPRGGGPGARRRTPRGSRGRRGPPSGPPPPRALPALHR